MKPYYQDNSITIYCADCRDVLPELQGIDLTVTSPPYDQLRDYEGYSFEFEAIAKELFRVTKPGGVVVWVVGDETIGGSETLTSFKQALHFKRLGFNVETMIYQVAGTGAKGSGYYYWQTFEYMFVFAKGQPKTSNRIADVKNTSAGKPRGFSPKAAVIGSRVNRPLIIAPEYSVRPNVWRYTVGRNDKTDHPAPFPESLANDHIRTWANAGELILDPMMGSGTTLKMARLNGCKAIGIEISEKYCEIAAKRLEQRMLNFG